MDTLARELDAPPEPAKQRGKIERSRAPRPRCTQLDLERLRLRRAGQPYDDEALRNQTPLVALRRRRLARQTAPARVHETPVITTAHASQNGQPAGQHGRERRGAAPRTRGSRRTRASSSRGDPDDSEPRSCQGCGKPCKTGERTCGACRQREHAERKRLAEQEGAETIAELRAAIWTLEALSGNGRGRDQLATLRGQLAAAEREREQLPPALKLCSCPEPIAARDGTDPACFRCGRFTVWPTGDAAFDRRPYLSSPLGRVNTLVPPRSEKRLRTRLASDKRPSITKARPISAEKLARYNGAAVSKAQRAAVVDLDEAAEAAA